MNIFQTKHLAQQPDLRSIINDAEKYWNKKDISTEEFEKQFSKEFWDVISGIQTLQITKKTATGKKYIGWLEVAYTAKDDYTTYGYNFSIMMVRKLRVA